MGLALNVTSDELINVNSENIDRYFDNVTVAIAADTGSMEPLIKGGDKLYVRGLHKDALIMPGDVYCYSSEHFVELVCHRAIGCYPYADCNKQVIFQGDNLHIVEIVDRLDVKERVIGINFR